MHVCVLFPYVFVHYAYTTGEQHKYWVYHGSLTTPPCEESVTWIVFHRFMPVTPQQVRVLDSTGLM